MRVLGRFATRDDREGPVLVLGAVVQNDLIKPGHVYQLEEILGEVVIKDMGLSSINMDERYVAMDNDEPYPYQSWGCSINKLVQAGDGAHILTTEEWRKMYIKKERID